MGFICPSETPEGASIGLVKNLSMISTITCSSDSNHIRELLNKNKDIIKLIQY